MIYAQKNKLASLFVPQSVGTETAVTGTVDVSGWDYAEVVVHLDTAAASSTDATLELSEADVTTYATSADMEMTTAAPNTNTPQIYRWCLDLRKRKKNLKIEYLASGAARLASAHVVLSRGEQAPATAAAKGLAGEVVA